jgi:hypothetical protein
MDDIYSDILSAFSNNHHALCMISSLKLMDVSLFWPLHRRFGRPKCHHTVRYSLLQLMLRTSGGSDCRT